MQRVSEGDGKPPCSSQPLSVPHPRKRPSLKAYPLHRLLWQCKSPSITSRRHTMQGSVWCFNDQAYTNTQKTALHFVASKKNLETAKILIENKASTRVRDRRGQYPIHRAAATGSVPMVLLFLRNRSPLNATDNEGFTPLHHASAEGHGAFTRQSVQYLVKNLMRADKRPSQGTLPLLSSKRVPTSQSKTPRTQSPSI
jgi:ankyrin repeat protein